MSICIWQKAKQKRQAERKGLTSLEKLESVCLGEKKGRKSGRRHWSVYSGRDKAGFLLSNSEKLNGYWWSGTFFSTKPHLVPGIFLHGSMVKNPPAMGGLGSNPGLEQSPGEGGNVTHSNIIAYQNPWTEEPWLTTVPWHHKESDMI